jgi:hypothetical protein
MFCFALSATNMYFDFIPNIIIQFLLLFLSSLLLLFTYLLIYFLLLYLAVFEGKWGFEKAVGVITRNPALFSIPTTGKI